MKSNHLINNNKSILGRTLEPLYEAYNSKSNNTAYLIYNDGVPTSMNYSRKYGHTKGLLVWNRIQGIWLIHSVPRFPPVPKDGYDYPSSGRLYGQSGICITFKYSQYKKIDFQLFVSQPNIYSCSIPDIFHQEIVHMTHMCAKSGSLNIPGRRLATLQSAQGLVFFHFAKSSLYTDDIFTGWMAQSLKTPLLAQTWQRRNHELPSNCSLRYHVYNINYIRLDRKHSFSSYHDHSKWCVSRNFNNHWTCIGDLNRDPHQAFREANNMAKAGDKSVAGGKRGLKRKAAAEEPQEAAVADDGAAESGAQPRKAAAFPPGFSISEIKNKQRRHLMFTRWKQQQRKEKLAAKKKLKKEREALGDKAPPKAIPKTIDNQRVYDETTVDPNDEEVAYDEATDEFSSYFNRQTSPKILITTSDRPHGRRGKDPTKHVPEIILNNFTTRLGHSIGRMFASLFPHNPQFIGRQVATFHNQRDYIFFRFHRYIFKSEKKVGIQELGPRFTLKLRSLQKGTFDSKYGEFEWVHKVRDKEHITLPDLIDFPSFPSQRVSSRLTDSSLLKIEREKIIEQMKQVKEERKYLENIREELLKKVEKLFEQNKSKRYHVCDSWKKKYLDTKKVTASLEEVLTKLREDLELYYKKLLMQLEAREIKMRPRNLANISDSKNYLIIQITEVQHAIDQLKRKLDTDKMKLILEVKMRKQAVSDLQTLKAELTQKKMGTSFRPPICMFI
ncbi:Deoxyribonuclease-2-beta [Microtus ochrogaster]|uniref:Deoxyribonuclease-2-beta n=1 Tax=Microtus ochrogaster TaxID=79684 RepID=A0A8J6H0T2_MICOH|nr:Deoxyribonuclease-2-beta [Microtus ochrogaster]